MDTSSINTTKYLNGKQLAKLLDVSAPTLSEAAKKGHNCAGYPVTEWAETNDTGRIMGYHVPSFLTIRKLDDEKTYTGLERINPNKANIRPNEGKNDQKDLTTEDIVRYSLLPESEDYVRPISMVTLSSVIKKALDTNTPQSRAVIASSIAGFGAIIGHLVTNDATGAGIGAGTGLGIALLIYLQFNNMPVNDNGSFKMIPQHVADDIVSKFLE